MRQDQEPPFHALEERGLLWAHPVGFTSTAVAYPHFPHPPPAVSSASEESGLLFPFTPPHLGAVSGAVPGGPALRVHSAGSLHLQPPRTWLWGCPFHRQQRDQLLCDPARRPDPGHCFPDERSEVLAGHLPREYLALLCLSCDPGFLRVLLPLTSAGLCLLWGSPALGISRNSSRGRSNL